jgi:hypothetical protein
MMIKWFFEITISGTPYYWSTEDYTWNLQAYDNRIIPNTFNSVSLRRTSDENGISNPSDTSFSIHTPITSTSAVIGEVMTIRLVVDDVQERVWAFRVKRYEISYGKGTFYLESILNTYLSGEYPRTLHPREVWPSSDSDFDPKDDYVIPKVFGEAFIPLRSVNTGTERYYVLGDSANTYVIDKVVSPREWSSQSEWDSGSYTFTKSDDSGYKVFQAFIEDNDRDGIYNPGVWINGNGFYDVPTKFTSTEISASSDVSPADVIEFFLLDIGVPASLIDTGVGSSFESAASQYSTWGISWNGGWYEQNTREQILSNLLNQCASTLIITDKIELHPRITTSQATIDTSNIERESFSYSPLYPTNSDGGYIEFINGDNTPQDRPTKVAVWSNSTQSSSDDIDNPISTTLNCTFIRDSQVAQKCGVLYFNRKLDKKGSCSFVLIPDTSFLDLNPDDVITLNSSFYGETRTVMIKNIDFNRDSSIKVEAIEFVNTILSFNSISPSSISVTTDNTNGFNVITGASPLINIKINIRDFTTSANFYAYIHGYNSNGDAADINGGIGYNGNIISIPKVEDSTNWTIFTSQEEEGYIVLDTGLTGKFFVSSTNHSVVFAKLSGGVWSYDNGAGWTDWTPSATDIVIGTMSVGASSINSANVSAYGQDLGSISEGGGDNTETVVNTDMLEIQGWTFSGTFSSTDANTVSWTSGTLTFSGSQSFSINSGNTGNMGATTYIYFSKSTSEIALQTTTSATNSVGSNKVLICVAMPGTTEARFIAYGDGDLKITGVQIEDDSITAANIAANTITSTEIASNTITANEIASNTITASEINTGSISIGSFSGAGDLAEQNTVNLLTQVTNRSLANLDSTANSKLNGIDAGADVTQTQLNLGAAIDNAKANGVTLISGGYIRTSLLSTDVLVIGDNAGALATEDSVAYSC